MTSSPDPRAIPYRQSAREVVAALESDSGTGLVAAEALARLVRYGRNALPAAASLPA